MKKWLKRIGIFFGIVVLLFGLLVIYAYFIEPRRFVVTEEAVAIPNWEPELDGFRVVAISDIHAGSNYAPSERLRRVVEQANAQNADLIVLLGDYVSEVKWNRSVRNKPEDVDGTELRIPAAEIAENLRELKAKYGVFAVIGNHDWYHNARKITAEFERVGIDVLDNEVSTIEAGGRKIQLWGIEDFWKNRKVPVEAYESIADKRNIVAITHNPDSLFNAPAGISIMFAGHSHGGQLDWPIFGPIRLVNDRRFKRGHVVLDGKHVYVTTGVGTSVVPFRFRVPPEIAVVTLSTL